jgi:hypothetical protein
MAAKNVLPVIGYEENRRTGDAEYRGTWEAFRAHDLVPTSMDAPPERRRGITQWEHGGRKCRLTRSYIDPERPYVLTVYLTEQERQDWKRQAALEAKSAELEERIQSLSVSNKSFRKEALRDLTVSFNFVIGRLFKVDGHGKPTSHSGPCAYSSTTLDELLDHYWELRRLLEEAELECHGGDLQTLKRQRAALQDESLQGFLSKVAA